MSGMGKPLLLSPGEALRRFLTDLEKPARILVAVSGGSDSLGLLVGLQQALQDAAIGDVDIVAATIDHGLRPRSAEEALGVSRFCTRREIPHVIRRWDADKPAGGLSAAARTARYDLLFAVAQEHGANAILTGHTLDDQIETLLMRSARAGGDTGIGAAGMAAAVLLRQSIWLLRPFLQTRRQAIRAMLVGEGITWTDDPSNEDPRFERARTRAGLFIDDAEAEERLAGIAAAGQAREALSDAAAGLIDTHMVLHRQVLAHLSPTMFESPPAVWRHALGLIVCVLGGRAHAPGRETMARITAFAQSGRPGRLTAGRVVFDRRRDGLYLVRESRDLPRFELAPGASVDWDGRFRVSNRLTRPLQVEPHPGDRAAALFAFPGVPSGLSLQAFSAIPRISGNGDTAGEDVFVQPVLQPYAQFLPQFDLKPASSLAKQLGLAAFPAVPLNVFMRKTSGACRVALARACRNPMLDDK